jgi:2-polyprenyl-6-hydroxyphenyl methylase/3-demethylubiquinone-9 3-methyltransferase
MAKANPSIPSPSSPPSTADAEDVERFSRLAASWWDPTGPFKPLHAINPVRLEFIRDRLTKHLGRRPLEDNPLRDIKLLDIGCGGGLLCEPMRRLGAHVTGIDASENSIGTARAHAATMDLDITYRASLPEDLAAENVTFDVVLNMEVVEHVADIGDFLRACSSLVTPGGAMVVATLNRTLKSLALAKVGAEYILRWLPPGTHDWRKFVRPSELVAGLRTVGMGVQDISGMTYAPFTEEWSLGDDLDVNYLVFATKEA